MIDFSCPRCGSTQREADSAAGKKVPCTKCGQRLKVPDPLEMRTIQAVSVLPKTAAGATQTAVSTKKQWYYQEGEKQGGPVTWTDLQRMAVEGELSLEQLVWGEGMAGWTNAKAVPDLFPPPSRKAPSIKKSSGRLIAVAVLFLFGTVGVGAVGAVGYLGWQAVARPESSKGTEFAAAKTDLERSTAPKTEPKTEPERPLEPKEIFDRCSPSVVRVLGSNGSGSGFLARPGLVVTNAHVVEDELSSRIQVTFPSVPGGNTPLKATLLHIDRKRDLAVLRITTSQPPLPLADRDCTAGEKVVVIGSPGSLPGQAVENSVTTGVLSARTQLDDEAFGGKQDWYQISAAVNPGNSGGPVFDSKGRVIGAVTLAFHLGRNHKEGMNFAVPFAEVIKALDTVQARTPKDFEAVAAQHDAIVGFRAYQKSADVYFWGTMYAKATMVDFVKSGKEPAAGFKEAMERIGKRTSGVGRHFLDPDTELALVPVFKNTALDEDVRKRLKELRDLHSNVKDLFESPRTIKEYFDKSSEFETQLERIFKDLCRDLELKGEERMSPDEWKRIVLR